MDLLGLIMSSVGVSDAQLEAFGFDTAPNLNIVMLGDHNTGKTTLSARFHQLVHGKGDTCATQRVRTTGPDGRGYRMYIWDTVGDRMGSERMTRRLDAASRWFRGLAPAAADPDRNDTAWFENPDAVIVCFALEHRWESVHGWLDSCLEGRVPPNARHACLVVGVDFGNKSHLLARGKERRAASVRGATFAGQKGVPYVEVNVDTGEGVDRCFQLAMALALGRTAMRSGGADRGVLDIRSTQCMTAVMVGDLRPLGRNRWPDVAGVGFSCQEDCWEPCQEECWWTWRDCSPAFKGAALSLAMMSAHTCGGKGEPWHPDSPSCGLTASLQHLILGFLACRECEMCDAGATAAWTQAAFLRDDSPSAPPLPLPKRHGPPDPPLPTRLARAALGALCDHPLQWVTTSLLVASLSIPAAYEICKLRNCSTWSTGVSMVAVFVGAVISTRTLWQCLALLPWQIAAFIAIIGSAITLLPFLTFGARMGWFGQWAIDVAPWLLGALFWTILIIGASGSAVWESAVVPAEAPAPAPAPAQAPVQAPMQAPAPAPMQAPVQAPVQAQVAVADDGDGMTLREFLDELDNWQIATFVFILAVICVLGPIMNYSFRMGYCEAWTVEMAPWMATGAFAVTTAVVEWPCLGLGLLIYFVWDSWSLVTWLLVTWLGFLIYYVTWVLGLPGFMR